MRFLLRLCHALSVDWTRSLVLMTGAPPPSPDTPPVRMFICVADAKSLFTISRYIFTGGESKNELWQTILAAGVLLKDEAINQ